MIDTSILSRQDLEKFIQIQSALYRQEANFAEVKAIREYYRGEVGAALSVRQEEFLNLRGEFGLTHNVFGLIVDTVVERLSIKSITSTSDEWSNVWDRYLSRRFAAVNADLFVSTYVDGESYLIVDYVPDSDEITIRHKKLYDGHDGVAVTRDIDGNIAMATYYYFDRSNELDRISTVGKRIVYLPDVIIKQDMRMGRWADTDIIDWTDMSGKPLGIPIIDFDFRMREKAISLIGLQDALNKAWVDLIAATDTHGFPILTISDAPGLMLADSDDDIDGSDELRVSPGRVLRDSGKISRIQAAELSPMIDTIWNIVLAMSSVSKVPHYYLRQKTEVAGSDGELEKSLTSLLNNLKIKISGSYMAVLELGSKLRGAYGPAEISMDGVNLSWQKSEVRNDLHEAQIAHLHWIIGVPRELILERLGYSAEEVARFGGFIDTQGEGSGAPQSQRIREIGAVADVGS